MKYPESMDIECIPLCDALNSIPGITTRESCCGHGTDSFQIWFSISDRTKFLTVIGRVFDRRYGGSPGWVCLVDNSDIPESCPAFLIHSGDIKGEQAYDDSKSIAKNIYDHLKSDVFCRMFGLPVV